jgi:nucleotide-binding universal stress UspA family protein
MKKILVALDGSPRADDVLSHALSIARMSGAKLVLFRSFGIPPDMTLAWPASDEPLEAALRDRAQKYLDERATRIPPELFAGVHVSLGTPWEAVCSMARRENVDLIVIGSHGYSGVDHILGTTAAKIVNHADRPVLVVRPIPSAVVA